MNKEQIFQAGKPKTVEVQIPEWGDGDTPLTLTIQQLTGTQLKECVEHINEGKPGGICQIVASVINGDGQRLFSWDDIPNIEAMSGAGIATLNIAINELNGFTRKN